MATTFKEGESVFFVFENGKSVLNSHFEPRWYKSKENFQKQLRYAEDRMKVVEYVPLIHAHVVVNWLGDCWCSNCKESIDCTSNYCNRCGAKLDEPEQKED